MYRRIIIGFNDSDSSRDALALGSAIAEATSAEARVVGICAYGPDPVMASPAMLEDIEHGRDEFRARVRAAADAVGASGETELGGSPAHGLHDAAERYDADLIVVGSSNRAESGHVRAGHIGHALLHGGPCAVAVAPAGYRDRGTHGLTRIGVGIDDSPESRNAVHAGAQLARSAGAELTIYAGTQSPTTGFTAGNAGWGYGTYDVAGLLEGVAQANLDDVTSADTTGLGVSKMVLGGYAPERLKEVAADLDLLVLGSRAYGPIRRVLLGSVSGELLNSAPCPVLVVPRGVRVENYSHPAEAVTGASA